MPTWDDIGAWLASLQKGNAARGQFAQAAPKPMPKGLTGLDPKFINDPRFDYIQKLVQNKPTEDNPNPWLVLMGNPQRDDYDSAPVAAKSTLAVDESWQSIAAEMENKSIGPSPWFTENTKDIQRLFGSQKITQAMAEEMRRRMLNTRSRIEDRY